MRDLATTVFRALGGALLVLAATASSSMAQSTNAAPVITYGSAEVDPASLPLVSDDAKQTLKDAIARMKSGDIVGEVFVASLDGQTWASRLAQKNEVLNVEELAREGLESCEYFSHARCFVLAVNGHDARDATGGWPAQPAMLSADPGSLFDATRVPFISDADRIAVRPYAAAVGARAFVVTANGGWLYRPGDDVFKAIAQAYADCQTTYPGQGCILYAVNDRVLFTP